MRRVTELMQRKGLALCAGEPGVYKTANTPGNLGMTAPLALVSVVMQAVTAEAMVEHVVERLSAQLVTDLMMAVHTAVQRDGLLASSLLTHDVGESLDQLESLELLHWGRVPEELRDESGDRNHWVELTTLGWAVTTSLLPTQAANRVSERARRVFEAVGP